MVVKHENIIFTSPDSLAEILGESEAIELEMHRLSTEASLVNSNIRYFNPNHFGDSHDIAVQDPITLLGDSAIKSVMMHTEVYSSTVNLPSEDEIQRRSWRVKTHNSTNGSDIRFFIAKIPVGSIRVNNEITAQLTQRRTFAAVALDASLPREIDMLHSLGVQQRHERDTRDVIVAPTTMSLYAAKIQH